MQIRLGRILVSAGRLDEAQETLEQAAVRAPEDPDVRLALIEVLVKKADMAGAAGQYEQLAEQDPENPDYLLRWGQILLEDEKQELSDRRDAAAKVWNRLADARQDDAVTTFANRGSVSWDRSERRRDRSVPQVDRGRSRFATIPRVSWRVFESTRSQR